MTGKETFLNPLLIRNSLPRRLFVLSKFSAPTIAFLAFRLAKKTPTMSQSSEFLRHMENSAPSLHFLHT